MTPYWQRRAEWVWRQRGVHAIPFGVPGLSAADEQNRYVYFRRAFTLEPTPQTASALVSADGRYQLYVNGHLVGRGPARCHPAQQQADPYDLLPYLQPGNNVIAALAHSYDKLTAWYELPGWEHSLAFGCGGFFLEGAITFASGIPFLLDTGETWRCLESPAWERDVPSGSVGFTERYDARREPVGWNTIDFDDSGWDTAEVLRVPGRQFAADIVPFPMMVLRDIPPLRESLASCESILRIAEVTDAPPAGNIATLFDHEPLAALSACSVVGNAFPLTITTIPGRSVSLVLDFGRIVTGRLRFTVDAPDGAVLDFTHSERLREDGRVLIHQGIPNFDTPQAHRVTLRAGYQTWEAFEWAGFRYAQITLRHCERPLSLHAVEVNQTGYPVEAHGQFACSDELLNRVWQVGANTVRLCMHDAYVDCPSREQRQYMGDAYVQTQVNYAAFGDADLAARLLRQIAASQLTDGLVMMCAPGDFARLQFLNIPDFTLYWIMTLERYIQFTGDTALAREMFPVIFRAVGWFERFLNPDGLLTDVPHWVFVDWAELDKNGQVTALNAQFVAALVAAAQVSRLADQEHEAARYEALAAQVTAGINHMLWDEVRGVYVDARGSRRVSQQANAAAIAFGVAPVERWPRMLDAIMDESRLVLTRTGEEIPDLVPFNEEQQIVMAQPFYGHHLHRALAQAGRVTALLDHIRRRWGALVAAGDDTFPETWQISELTSLCHGWSATPTFDLSTEVLGITPLTPGFTRFRVAPQPAGLTWARGTFPTPHGAIAVDWRIADGAFTLTLTVPEDTEAEVALAGLPVTTAAPGTHEFCIEDANHA
ncbi:MAG: family 78 glycoside hydrolase catalytic domain [Anaerolineaceae bacterium]|nr:family 78 glycoside hydrolase catalytic domain [Anaerolineaceae bacterium]